MRDYDGTDDNLDCGADASMNGWRTLTLACWVQFDSIAAPNNFPRLMDKGAHTAPGGGGAYDFMCDFSGVRRVFLKVRNWGTTTGEWRSNTSGINAGTRYHFAVVYDGNSTANDPTFYINGVSDGSLDDVSPAGSWATDTKALLMGASGGSPASPGGPTKSGFLDGVMGWNVAHNGLLTAADINRAKWWGRPRGGLSFYHPGITNKTANEGTATASATVNGSPGTRSFPTPVVRPGSAMMGCGVGF